MLLGAARGMRIPAHGVRALSTSAARAQAPRPPRMVPVSHVRAGTQTPKDPLDVARRFPDHPLMRFFQRVPVEIAREGTQGKHADERKTIMLPAAVTENDLSHEYSSRSWLASELRRKSSAELHTLWYILIVERNKLATSWEELKRNNAENAARMLGESLSHRHHRVRKSMARIKFVLNERRMALVEAQHNARSGPDTAAYDDEDLFESEALYHPLQSMLPQITFVANACPDTRPTMLEGVLASVLNRFLAAYVDGLNTSQLNVGIWSGDVTLKNLKLKRTALEKVNLPIDVREGYLGQLTLSIPWSNLKGKPVRVLVKNVSLLASPRDASGVVDPEAEEARAQELKQERLAQDEMLSSGMPVKNDSDLEKAESFISSLVTKIVDNVQVTVQNIHIRYEDDTANPGSPFAVGVTLAELSAVSTDEHWVPAFVHNSAYGIHKLAKLDSLSVYWDTDTQFLETSNAEELQLKLNEMIPTKDTQPPHQYVLEPVSGAGKLVIRNHATKDVPAMDAQLSFEQIGFTLDDAQYCDMLYLGDLFHFYSRRARYLSMHPADADLDANKPRALFKFAIRAVLTEVHERHRIWTWDFFKKRRDERKNYIKAFIASQKHALPVGAHASPLASTELEHLERGLDYRDIRRYRSLARRQLREQAPPAPDPAEEKGAPAPSQPSGGWFGWLWGAPDQSKGEEHPTLNTEQRKELYDAIEWDEDTGTSRFSKLDNLPKEAVKAHVTARLDRGFFNIKDHARESKIISLAFDTLQGEMSQRPDNLDVSCSLGALRVLDGTSHDTKFPQIVHVKGDDDDGRTDATEMEKISDPENPLLYILFEHNPLDGRADNALTLTMRSLEVVYHRSYVESIIRFFSPPEREMELLGALIDAASETLEGIRKETRIGLENVLETHKTIDVSLDVKAPIIVIPEDVTSRDSLMLVLDAGHIAMRSLLADPETMDAIRAKHNRPYSEQDYRQLEDMMYDRYFIKLEAAQLVLGRGYEANMKSIQQDTPRMDRHLLERINLSFTLQISIVPSAPTLTKCKLSGNLPSLNVHFSDAKYRTLMRIIDASIPRLDKAVQRTPTDMLLAQPRRVHEEDDDDVLDDESDTSTHSSDNEQYATSVSDVRRALQKTFEFELVVGCVQGTVSKSGAPAQSDTLLVQAVFRNFRLGVHVYPSELQVSVNLGSLDLVDKIVDQAPQFCHMITSRPFASLDKTSDAETDADDHDLVTVQYTNVSPDSPNFMDKYDGVDSCVLVDLHTISLMLTRKTVLTVYDWIMMTFVSGDAEHDKAPEPAAPALEAPAAPTQVKFRVKVKLDSVQLRLNDDGVLLSTLTLSTADIAVLMRESGTRVAMRLGSLSLRDEIQRQRADPDFANLVSIDGGELADFALETFTKSDPHYPGYDTSFWLRCGAVKAVFASDAISDLLAYFAKFAKMKAVYDAATTAASAQASQFQASQGRTRYDLLVKSPILLVPLDVAKLDMITAHLGELYLYNQFTKVKLGYQTTLDAGLGQIQLVSRIVTDGNAHELHMLEDVHLGLHLEENEDVGENGDARKGETVASNVELDVDVEKTKALVASRAEPTAASSTDAKVDATADAQPDSKVDAQPDAKADAQLDAHADSQPDAHAADAADSHSSTPTSPSSPPQQHFSATLSDVNVKLTHGQYTMLLALATSISRAFANQDAFSAEEMLPPQTEPPKPSAPRACIVGGQFSVDNVDVNLYDTNATDEASLASCHLFRFSLHDILLKMHQHPQQGTEAEFTLSTFSVVDTRPSRETHFRELIPAISHDGKQLMLNYTVSLDNQALAVITLDSPKFIFSVDPLFALLRFFAAPSEELREHAPAPTATTRARTVPAPPSPTPQASDLPEQRTLFFRINVVEPRILLLSAPERADSEAIVLTVRQLLLSRQTVMALSVTEFGIFVWRMNAPKDKQRLLNNTDLSLSVDSRTTPAGPVMSIDLDVDALLVRVTRSDVQLITSVINTAIAMSVQEKDTLPGSDNVIPQQTLSGTISDTDTPATTHKTSQHDSHGKLFVTREELAVSAGGIQIMVISEAHMLPLIDARVQPFRVSIADWSADLRVYTTLQMYINNYNFASSYWEPLLEPWEMELRYERFLSPSSISFVVSSAKRMEVNVSATFLETMNNMVQLLDKDRRLRDDMRHMAPFRIRNVTGYRLSVWAEPGSQGGAALRNAQHIDNGTEIPWAFGDWKSLRENPTEASSNKLAVHLDEMPWERLRHLQVDREGEFVLALRPKLERVSHRLLCEIRLENNVKIITFRSTFSLVNRCLIPIQVGILDDHGSVKDTLLHVPPGEDSSLPILEAYYSKIRIRPAPGLGYAWSSEAVGWQELMYASTHKLVCAADDTNEAPFLFQGFAVRDVKSASMRSYPRVVLSLRAPVEIENLLPHDVQYRLFDKNLNHNWSSFLRLGGLSPVHVVQLDHLLLLSIDVDDTPFSPSEFAVIASDNPDDFQVEHVLPLVDKANNKLELRLHYYTYPDSGGAFKVQIYAPYIFLNQSQMPVLVRERLWASHTSLVAGQATERDEDALAACKPLLLSRFQERKSRFLVRAGDSAWSKPLSFDVIGSEVEVSIQSTNADREAHLGLDVGEGLGHFKLSKVVKLTPRYMIHNLLPESIRLCEVGGGDYVTIEAYKLLPLHWLHVNSTKHAMVAYARKASPWTAPFSIDNIGTVFLRAARPDAAQHLIQVEAQMAGAAIFVKIKPCDGPWPFVLRNETNFTIHFAQTAALGESTRGRRAIENEQGAHAELKRYELKPRSKMKYAWDYPADSDKFIRLEIHGRERVVNILEIGSLLPFRFPVEGKSNAVVSLDVRADGESQTLVISNYSESASRFKIASSTTRSELRDPRDTGFEAVDVDTRILASYKIMLQGVGVSIISAKVSEIAYLTFEGLELVYSESEVTTAVNVICKWIQIDNQMYESIFPVVLYPTVIPKDGKELDVHPALEASIIRLRDETHGVLHIKYASVLLQEMTAEMDENFLFAVYNFYRASSATMKQALPPTMYIEYADRLCEPDDALARTDEAYIEILHLQPIALNLSFVSTNRVDVDDTESSRTLFLFIFNALIMTLGNVNDAPIRLNALVIENVRMSMTVLQQRVAYHYGQEFLFQIHRVLGSADFLGNPVGLFNNVSSGVADIFYEPYYGLVMHGNRELGFGIARGASNFVKKTVFGVTDSVSKLTGSISKGLTAVTMDPEYQNRWRMSHFRNKPRHALYGIASGTNSLFTSVASGIEGLALRPLEGAEDGGTAGFLQGIGRGLVGAVTKPAAGFFDMASSITEGMRNTMLVFDQHDIHRIRLPRFIPGDKIVRLYSPREALGQMWLRQLDQSRLAHDHYVAHVDIPGPHGGSTVMISEHRVLFIRTTKLKVLWEVLWPDLSTISLEPNGISLVLRGGVMGPFLPIAEASTRVWLFKQISGVVQQYNAAHV
ncbi:Vacuolar protein sorting-associated protein 13 [Malassezia vespertilionis]|uniref:Vacuolar protein sorting-associated protein 13 n=1 Tax=Malassezia vespertilionis TaxID=2020962 RepID=UPI0024B10861|nr:Vacuolar protein sorting-associated protein 13 [Malassezia vespertilionis]WFD07777.1 Vacuolar protein sorting-associated protein 13 [Malassezia vespertilionis]